MWCRLLVTYTEPSEGLKIWGGGADYAHHIPTSPSSFESHKCACKIFWWSRFCFLVVQNWGWGWEGGIVPLLLPLFPPALNYSGPKDHAICIFICMLVSLDWKLKSLFRYSLLFIYNVCPVFAYSLSLDIICLLAASADIYFAQCICNCSTVFCANYEHL